jgi:RsiW-degrading membrane proteinase PrsW (M82 family)
MAGLSVPVESADTAAADRTLMIGGGACVAVTVLSVVLRLSGAMPSGLATVIVVAVMGIGLRIFVRYAARSASSAHRTHVTKTISLVGLGVSVVALISSLPILLRSGDSGHFVSDIFAHLWVIAILLAVIGTARTLNWLVLVGMALTGFLAVSGLAFTVGRPVVKAMGENSAFATAFYVPFTEEVLKALPALLILIFAARRKTARPSAVEMALVGAVLGSGFAAYEDTQFHRGGFHFGAMPIVSIVNPTSTNGSSLHITYAGAGHMIYTALIVFGLALGLLYRSRYSWARYAIPVSFAVALAEHCTQNYAPLVATHQGSTVLFDLLRVVTLWGWLSSLLLVAGIALVARDERRATSNGLALRDTVASSFWLTPASARYAATALARTQLGADLAPTGGTR